MRRAEMRRRKIFYDKKESALAYKYHAFFFSHIILRLKATRILGEQ